MTTLTIALNCDDQDQPYGHSGVIWIDLSLANDSLIFTAGNTTVADGQPIPSSFQLSNAGPYLDPLNPVDILIDHYLLADLSANLLREVHLMGQQDTRYVVAFDFDGATTSEPVLEAWDNLNMNSTDLDCLGDGTPSTSWLHGVVTTDALPGSAWVGYALAGSSDNHFLWLNNQNGALSVAGTLYCNLYLKIPAAQTSSLAQTPILVCKYTTV